MWIISLEMKHTADFFTYYRVFMHTIIPIHSLNYIYIETKSVPLPIGIQGTYFIGRIRPSFKKKNVSIYRTDFI